MSSSRKSHQNSFLKHLLFLQNKPPPQKKIFLIRLEKFLLPEECSVPSFSIF